MRTVAAYSAICAITLVLIEAMLRVVPGIIPLSLLVHFNPELSTTIAERLDLPNWSTQKLVARDDQGPPLWVTPAQVITNRFRDPGSVNNMIRSILYSFCISHHASRITLHVL